QKFNNYMKDYQQRVQALVDKGQLEAAKKFAEIVRQKIVELVRKQPSYAELTESAIAEWTSKVNYIQKQMEEKQDLREEVFEYQIAGSQLLSEIHAYMNGGRDREASLAIEKFLREFPDHPDIDVVKKRREELD